MPRSRNRSGSQSSVSPKVKQLPYRRVSNRFPPLCVLSDDELEFIHESSLKVLEQVGIEVMSPVGCEMLASAGATVDYKTGLVRIDRSLVEQCLATTRPSFRVHARNPAHDIELGTDQICFATVGSAPHASDLDQGRRTGNHIDYRNFLRLTQQLNIIHLIGGYPVEPVDWHPSIRHLECLRDSAILTDKVFHAYSLGKQRNLDAIEMVKIVRQLDHVQLAEQPSLITVINSNSPLRLDGNMVQGIIEMSLRNQVVVLTPFTLAGAMAPVTLAGALTQQNAEVLSGVVISQLTNPGSPFVYGGFTSNVDMRSGAPAFGTPEYMKAALASGQLARRYGLPFRSSNTNASNCADAQAAYESAFSLWGAVNGHCHLLLHAAGWMEGGLTASFEKFIIDAELLQMISEYMQPIAVSAAEVGMDAMEQAGHGGHFFGTEHTRQRYRDAFYSPLISDWRNFETWSEGGAPQAMNNANRVYKQLLAEYAEPPLDKSVREELDDFVDRRIAEGGVKTDF